MDPTPRIRLLNAFESLVQQISQVAHALGADAKYPAWVVGSPTISFAEDYSEPRRQAIDAIQQLEYSDDQAPRDILLCPGFIGASPATLEAIATLNAAKESFKAVILTLKLEGLSHKDAALESDLQSILGTHRSQNTAQALKGLGLGRLHLKQCYRLLPILPGTLVKARWTWAHTRAITRITVADAYARLSKRKASASTAIQLQKLASLPSHEPLAIVQELAPHLRVNVVYREPDGTLIRKMIKGGMPLFYPSQPGERMPDFKAPMEKQMRDTKRPARADVKLESEPFLPGIRAHRYLYVD